MPSPAATLIALCDILSQPDFWRDDFRISFERFVCGIALGGGAGICLGLAAGFGAYPRPLDAFQRAWRSCGHARHALVWY